jgi:hypothetical protein
MSLACTLDFLNSLGQIGGGLQTLLWRHAPGAFDLIQSLFAVDSGPSSHRAIITSGILQEPEYSVPYAVEKP